MSSKEYMLWAEMARRKKQFHPNENWEDIKLWGLFSWGTISSFLKSGKLITDMKKENKIVWVRPSKEAYHKYIEPLLTESIERLTSMAGWRNYQGYELFPNI